MNLTGKGAIDTGTYTNHFLKSGYSEEEINARLEQTWNDLFYGDEHTESITPQEMTKDIYSTQETTMFVPRACPMA